MATTSYELGSRTKLNASGAIVLRWNPSNPLVGIKAFARDERTGDYVHVYEVAAEEYVQGEPQSWSSGNFETKESAERYASKAYRWINRRAGH